MWSQITASSIGSINDIALIFSLNMPFFTNYLDHVLRTIEFFMKLPVVSLKGNNVIRNNKIISFHFRRFMDFQVDDDLVIKSSYPAFLLCFWQFIAILPNQKICHFFVLYRLEPSESFLQRSACSSPSLTISFIFLKCLDRYLYPK